MDAVRTRRKRVGEDVIIREIRKGNLGYLSDERYEPFISKAFTVLKAADEGEYQHNIRLLAAMMVNDELYGVRDDQCVLRARRAISGMSLERLGAFVAFMKCYNRLSEKPVTGNNPDGYVRSVRPRDLRTEFRESQYGANLVEAEDIISDFVSRGLARITVDVDGIGGVAYAPTNAAREICDEAVSMNEGT